MTPPAKAGGFSGDGTGNPHRWRLKAPSGPLRQVQHVERGVQVAPQHQATSGAAMLPLGQCLGVWCLVLRRRWDVRDRGVDRLTLMPGAQLTLDRDSACLQGGSVPWV